MHAIVVCSMAESLEARLMPPRRGPHEVGGVSGVRPRLNTPIRPAPPPPPLAEALGRSLEVQIGNSIS